MEKMEDLGEKKSCIMLLTGKTGELE